MQPRTPNSITMMIAQAMEKMRELKELQFFGGDALNLGRYTQTVDVPPDGVKHCWRIVMTPNNPETTMPFMAQAKPATATSYTDGQVEAVHRTDGKFEYLIIAQNPDTEPRPMRITVEYTGSAEFSFTQIG